MSPHLLSVGEVEVREDWSKQKQIFVYKMFRDQWEWKEEYKLELSTLNLISRSHYAHSI
jgi:hypothetical protein